MEVRPTCDSGGYKREKCSRCGKINTVSYEAAGHTFEYNEESGLYECKFCGALEEKTENRNGAGNIFKNPILIAALAFIILQFIIAGVLVLRYKLNRKRIMQRMKAFEYDDDAEKEESSAKKQ